MPPMRQDSSFSHLSSFIGPILLLNDHNFFYILIEEFPFPLLAVESKEMSEGEEDTKNSSATYAEFVLRQDSESYHSDIGATLVEGTFVVFGDTRNPELARIKSYVPSRLVWKVIPYVFVNRRATRYHDSLGYYINSRVPDFPQRLMREVADPDWEEKEIAPYEIINIAFVFSRFDLQDPKFSWSGGIRNCYYLSSVSGPMSTIVSINGKRDVLTQFRPLTKEDGHEPFPVGKYAGSYAEVIWFGLLTVHETIQKGLNRYGQHQPLHFNIAIAFPNVACFKYIMRMAQRSTPINRIPNKTSLIATDSGYKKRRLIGDNTPYYLMRFDTEHALVCLRQILGVGVTEGVRSRPPTIKGHPHGKLFSEHTLLHYVKGAKRLETPYIARTKRRGIDLKFDGYNRLKVSVRFKTWLFRTNGNQRPIDLPSLHVEQVLYHFRDNLPVATNIKEYDSDDTSEDHCTIRSLDSAEESVAASDTTEDTLHSLIQPDTMFTLPDGNIYEIVVAGKEEIEYRLAQDGEAGGIQKVNRLDTTFRNGIRSYNGMDDDDDDDE
jgi:hypothetical protein